MSSERSSYLEDAMMEAAKATGYLQFARDLRFEQYLTNIFSGLTPINTD
jgi:hypothetical protein